MNARKWAAITGVGLGLSLAGGVTQGAVLSFEDDDIDFVLRAPGGVLNTTPVTSGPLAVGDILVSALEIPVLTIGGVNAIPAGQELTGVASIQIASITALGNGLNLFSFVAPTIGLNAILAAGGGKAVVNGGAGGGSVIAMWLNGAPGPGTDRDLVLNRSTNPATNCTGLSDCLTQASLGSLFQVDGFGAANNFWTAIQTLPGGNDIGAVLGTANDTLVAAANFALMSFFNSTGPVGGIDFVSGLACASPGAGTCVQFKGSATITGGQGLSNGAIAHSDFDAQKLVPEPGVLTLLGAALLAFGFARRERKA